MKLFAFYIGGQTATSMIELHDVRIMAAETLEDCYPRLRAEWWGTQKSLHLDCWGELSSADGHDIILRTEPYTGEDKLWFVNLGGYETGDFNELHSNVFVVAPTFSKAKVRALKTVLHWKGRHKDEIFEVENMVCVNDLLVQQGLHIHLDKNEAAKPFVFEQGYNTDVRKV